MSGRDAAGQAEDVARVPADGLAAPRRLTAPGDHVVDLTGGLEARGQRLAGAESRVAREDQRRRGGAVGAERRTEVERQEIADGGDEKIGGPQTEKHSQRATQNRQKQTFREKLAHDAHAAAAERETNGDLLPPRRPARLPCA